MHNRTFISHSSNVDSDYGCHVTHGRTLVIRIPVYTVVTLYLESSMRRDQIVTSCPI